MKTDKTLEAQCKKQRIWYNSKLHSQQKCVLFSKRLLWIQTFVTSMSSKIQSV